MSYCLAFSTEGAVDVSRGYIQTGKWTEAMKMRNMTSEEDLEKVSRYHRHTFWPFLTANDKALKSVTTRRRLGLPADVVERLEQEDVAMHGWLHSPDSERETQGRLEARQSGSEEWKEARGEAGPTV
jgi:peptide-N4-(N-acetyl-beta-glucosaminyl)asparagine amidase